MGYGKHVPTFDMPELYDRLEGPDCNDKGTPSLSKFCNKIGGETKSLAMFFGI